MILTILFIILGVLIIITAYITYIGLRKFPDILDEGHPIGKLKNGKSFLIFFNFFIGIFFIFFSFYLTMINYIIFDIIIIFVIVFRMIDCINDIIKIRKCFLYDQRVK